MGLFNSFISSMRDVASEVTSFAKNSFEEEENNEVEYGDDSPTSWTRHPWESDEDYLDRMNDQVGMMEGIKNQ